MRIVDHHDGAVLLRQRRQLVDRTDVAIHREDAVRNHQLVARLVRNLLQQLFAMGGIFVPEDLDLCPRKPRAINDAGVVQLV